MTAICDIILTPNPKSKNECWIEDHSCYDSKLKVLSNELTLVLSDTRELDRVPNTK